MATTADRKTRQQETVAKVAGQRRRGLPIAAAAAALALLVGFGTWFIIDSGEDAASPIELATIYMDARANNDPDAALRVLSATAALTNELPSVPELGELPGSFEYTYRLGPEWTYSCEELPSRNSTRVGCDYTLTNRLSRALDQGEFEGTYTFYIEDGMIVRVLNDFPLARYGPNVFRVFLGWLDREHPGAVDALWDNTGGSARFRHSDENFELLEQYIEEFEASLSG